MAIAQATVEEIVSWAVKKQLDIPEFQRDFVWSPQDVALLAESLYRDYISTVSRNPLEMSLMAI